MKIINDKIHIYDMRTNEFREITPKDVESFENITAAFGLFRTELKALMENTILIAQGKVDISDLYLCYENKTTRLHEPKQRGASDEHNSNS